MTGPTSAVAGDQGTAAVLAWQRAVDAAWQQVMAGAAPPVPGPPAPPKHDAGAGAHGSVPLMPNDPRLDVHGAVLMAAHAFSSVWPNGARHLLHYLHNTGEPLAVNPDDVLRDVPGLGDRPSPAAVVDQRLHEELRALAANPANHGVPTPVAVDWFTYNITPEQNKDWHYAIGEGNFAVTGVATVHPPAAAGSPPRVDVEYQVHVYDRYNWDVDVEGKQARIGDWLPAPDALLGQLHQAGLAKEYDTVGSTPTRRYSGEIR